MAPTRTAPGWIRDQERRYAFARVAWKALNIVDWLCWCGFLVLPSFLPKKPPLSHAGLFCFTAWLAFRFLNPPKRARRYGMAANWINVAVANYEVHTNQSESTLANAAKRAAEVLCRHRLRTAPKWIRQRRRSCTLRQLAWFSPGPMLAVVVGASAAAFHWTWFGIWHIQLVALAMFLMIVAASSKITGNGTAREILDKAMERYEFQAGATDEVLNEAARRADEALVKQVTRAAAS
jgi:hypothetical protein